MSLPTHPRTGIVALAVLPSGRVVYPVMGAADEPPGDPPADPPKDGAAGGSAEPAKPDKGYPEGTPVAEMTPEQQAAYWKTQSRKHEARAESRSDYNDLKRKAQQFDEAQRQAMSDQEKAVAQAHDEAKAEGRAEALREAGGKLVRAAFTAATAGRMNTGARDALLEALDTSRFLTGDGDVDTDKVASYADAVAPKRSSSGGDGFPDLGQGRRQEPPKASVASGRELYEQRNTKTS